MKYFLRVSAQVFSLIACSILFTSTTYVIQEGGKEVGRWDEADGKTEVQVISQDKPTTPPKPMNLPGYNDDGVGYGFKKEIVSQPEKIAVWKIGGRVTDIIRLSAVSGGTLVFEGAVQPIEIAVKGDGFFLAQLPRLKGSSYTVRYTPASPDYDKRAFFKIGSSFATLSYEQRLKLRANVPGSLAVNSDVPELYVGIMPVRLTAKEQADYQRVILPPSAPESHS